MNDILPEELHEPKIRCHICGEECGDDLRMCEAHDCCNKACSDCVPEPGEWGWQCQDHLVKFILVDGKVYGTTNSRRWAEFMESGTRTLEKTKIGKVLVSTVFLGLDHNYTGRGSEPILWETMIFGGKHDQYQERYSSAEAARAGHKKAVKLVEKSLTLPPKK